MIDKKQFAVIIDADSSGLDTTRRARDENGDLMEKTAVPAGVLGNSAASGSFFVNTLAGLHLRPQEIVDADGDGDYPFSSSDEIEEIVAKFGAIVSSPDMRDVSDEKLPPQPEPRLRTRHNRVGYTTNKRRNA